MRKIMFPALALSLIAAPTLAFATTATAPAKAATAPVKRTAPANTVKHVKVTTVKKDKKAS